MSSPVAVQQSGIMVFGQPNTGLDPAIASTIKSIIREENDQGVTIFLTTHNLYIADDLCDRVALSSMAR